LQHDLAHSLTAQAVEAAERAKGRASLSCSNDRGIAIRHGRAPQQSTVYHRTMAQISGAYQNGADISVNIKIASQTVRMELTPEADCFALRPHLRRRPKQT